MKKIIVSIVLLMSITFAAIANENEVMTNPYEKHDVAFLNVNSFCKLIQMGDYDAVKALIKEGEDVNKKSTGLTPLMFAARHNKAKIAKLLIAHGAKLKVKSDRGGHTALKYAELSNAKEAYEVIKAALVEQKNNKKRRG